MLLVRQRVKPVCLSWSHLRSASTQPRNRKWTLPRPSALSARSEQVGPTSLQPPSKHIPVSPILDRLPRLPSSSSKQSVSGRLNEQSNPVARISTVKSAGKDWTTYKNAIKARYPSGWRPTRRISPEAIEGIKILHSQVSRLIFFRLKLFRDRNSQILNLGNFLKYLLKRFGAFSRANGNHPHRNKWSGRRDGRKDDNRKLQKQSLDGHFVNIQPLSVVIGTGLPGTGVGLTLLLRDACHMNPEV
jgi:hypothetical protein